MFKPKFPKPLKNKFLVFLLLIYLIISIIMKIKSATFYYYTINPIFWSLIIIYTLTFIKRNKLVKEKKYIFYALVIGLIYLFMGFMSGLLVGFVNSPFNHNFYSLWQNSVTLIIPIIGIELARNILINKSNINPILVTFFLIFIELDFYSFFFTNNLFKFICSHIIPLLFSNMLFTYLHFLF